MMRGEQSGARNNFLSFGTTTARQRKLASGTRTSQGPEKIEK